MFFLERYNLCDFGHFYILSITFDSVNSFFFPNNHLFVTVRGCGERTAIWDLGKTPSNKTSFLPLSKKTKPHFWQRECTLILHLLFLTTRMYSNFTSSYTHRGTKDYGASCLLGMRLLHEKTMLPNIIKATSSELAALQSTHTSTHLSLSRGLGTNTPIWSTRAWPKIMYVFPHSQVVLEFYWKERMTCFSDKIYREAWCLSVDFSIVNSHL
jgi:hypothetical protein